jgi:hypothetical protein
LLYVRSDLGVYDSTSPTTVTRKLSGVFIAFSITPKGKSRSLLRMLSPVSSKGNDTIQHEILVVI